MLVCPIRTFRIMRGFKIIKYVQHALAGVWHFHEWKHKVKMAGLFVLFTCSTEPFVAFLRISGDQSATRPATLTKFTCALTFTLYFLFVIIEACLTPKVSVAKVTQNSRPRVFTWRTYYTFTTCLFASMYHAVFTAFVTTITKLLLRHSSCKVSYDMIVICYFFK